MKDLQQKMEEAIQMGDVIVFNGGVAVDRKINTSKSAEACAELAKGTAIDFYFWILKERWTYSNTSKYFYRFNTRNSLDNTARGVSLTESITDSELFSLYLEQR